MQNLNPVSSRSSSGAGIEAVLEMPALLAVCLDCKSEVWHIYQVQKSAFTCSACILC